MKKSNRNNKIFWIVLCIVAAVLVALLVIFGVHQKKLDEIEKEKTESEEAAALSFPYELEDGKLEVSSLFQFSGVNPDCSNTEGENIASLQIVNKSDEYLSSAVIEAELESGEKLTFELSDIPSGKSVMVFEKNNTAYDLSDGCAKISAQTDFTDAADLMEDSLSVSAQETAVTLTNTTDQDLANLLLYCHCLADEAYFGGLTYEYTVDSIPAGQSVTIQADDCYLGTAEVVRIVWQ